MSDNFKANKYIRNCKLILAFQYTEEFKSFLVNKNHNEFEDDYYIVISGMTDTEFFWYSKENKLEIVYSNYLNTYENVTPDNFRNPEVISVNDYVVKENGIYHIEDENKFKNSILLK